MNFSIELTPDAAAYLKTLLEKKPNALGLRVGVKAYGCSGWGYVVDYAEEIRDTLDKVFTMEGIQVIVDQKSLPYLNGLMIDCVNEGLNQSLKFNNPNATASCGCGESFSFNK